MVDELDPKLTRLFAESRRTLAGDEFSEQLMRKIGRARRLRLLGQVLLVAALVMLAVLNLRPLLKTAGDAVLMVGEISPASAGLLITPWGWVVSVLAGIWLLLRLRPSRR